MAEKGCFFLKGEKETWTEMSLEILILSDNADVRRQLKRLVDPNPAWKVVGTKACDKAMTGNALDCPPDVVIVEMSPFNASMLPRISSLRDKAGGSKILALSGHQDSRLVLRMIHAGAIGYLITDRAPEELAGAIETIVAGGTYLSPGIAGLTREGVRHVPAKGK